MDTRAVSAERLMRIPGHCDLLRGRVRTMTPPGPDHGWVCGRFAMLLSIHVYGRRLGRVYTNDTGFLLERDPDTVLGADVAFVRKGRLRLTPRRGYFPGPPDLAVEVRSPDDSRRKVREKAELWIELGTRLVVTADPASRSVTVYRPGRRAQSFTIQQSIDLGDVIAGLELSVAELFAD